MDKASLGRAFIKDVVRVSGMFVLPFCSLAGMDSLIEFHKIGHPISGILLDSFVTAALITIAFYVFKRTRPA